jgi:lipopolysaccharide/colanic/teichoic acid biosynthesis glycosyltransferase
MTANSQLISAKVIYTLIRRGFSPIASSKRRKKSSGVEIFSRTVIKRTFDIFFSLIVLIFCSPVYLILALSVALSSPGPVFYVQERVGKDFKRFNCIKFRTMVTNADELLESLIADSPELREEFENNSKLRCDPRVTAIGRFLRLTSLDEFPQFWNVLMGDMSVVGPRPLVPDELEKYGNRIDKVLQIRPGITGLWQVSGRNDIPYPQRVQIDVHYANSYNLLTDIWIIFKTVGIVIFPHNNGAY